MPGDAQRGHQRDGHRGHRTQPAGRHGDRAGGRCQDHGERYPQEKGAAGHRDAKDQVNEIAGGRRPEGPYQEAGGIIRSAEDCLEGADSRPYPDRIEEDGSQDAQAAGQVQRVVVRVVRPARTRPRRARTPPS